MGEAQISGYFNHIFCFLKKPFCVGEYLQKIPCYEKMCRSTNEAEFIKWLLALPCGSSSDTMSGGEGHIHHPSAHLGPSVTSWPCVVFAIFGR